MTEEEEDGLKRKKSVRQYVRKIFGESSVSAVSGIASTESLPRKAFKLIVFLILTSAFLYQVIKFLTYLYEYPTVVNIDLSKPHSYMAPAFTLCNSQILRRSKYCEKYPDRCLPTDEEFCKENRLYCQFSYTRVKKEYNWKPIDPKDILQMGYQLEDILEDFEPTEKYEKIQFHNTSFLRMRDFSDTYDTYSLCQTFNYIIQSSEDPIFVNKSDFMEREVQRRVLRFRFDPQEADRFDPDILPGIYFAVHSPYEAVNPFKAGHNMLPGRRYKISIRLKEEELLPYPYQTDCIDYIQIWNKNNRTGPRTKGMCKQKCYVDFISICYNCSWPTFNYPSDKEEICSPDAYTRDEDTFSEECKKLINGLEGCENACKEDCLKKLFVATVRELHLPKNLQLSNDSKQKPLPIHVDVNVHDDEILRYVFSPKYQEVEAFSYIGGFIGIWLGISLVQVTEFFESLFLIGRYLFKRCTHVYKPQTV